MNPRNWPSCPACGGPTLDGHLTCGRVECEEAAARQALEKQRRRRDRRAREFAVVAAQLLDEASRRRLAAADAEGEREDEVYAQAVVLGALGEAQRLLLPEDARLYVLSHITNWVSAVEQRRLAGGGSKPLDVKNRVIKPGDVVRSERFDDEGVVVSVGPSDRYPVEWRGRPDVVEVKTALRALTYSEAVYWEVVDASVVLH